LEHKVFNPEKHVLISLTRALEEGRLQIGKNIGIGAKFLIICIVFFVVCVVLLHNFANGIGRGSRKIFADASISIATPLL